jgi:bifunctional non-homologous end joining protein LigD
MQPVDALHDKAHYVSDQAYWGQPKIDGHKLIVFASPDNRYYQSRSMKLSSAPGAEMDLAFKQTAAKIGNFILEGELTFLDHNGGQHRTGSQAANAEGNTDKTVRMVYYVFSALYAGHCALKTYGDCVLEGRMIAAELREICSDIDFCETSRMSTSKQLLIEQNEKEDREGEIWFNPMLTYSPGKRNDDMFVRTKRLTEFEAIVTGLTDTTAQGHAFGAMEVSDLNGKPVGAIGTGFTLHEKAEIKKRFENGRLKVSIVSQGFTESGMAWHGRFAGFV